MGLLHWLMNLGFAGGGDTTPTPPSYDILLTSQEDLSVVLFATEDLPITLMSQSDIPITLESDT